MLRLLLLWWRVEMGELNPGWTDYRHEVMCREVDVTPYLAKTGQKRIEYATARTETPHGTVTSSWKLRDDGSYEYRFALPEVLPYDIDIPSLSPRDKVVVTQK